MSSIIATLSNIYDREFYENNANSFLHIFSSTANSDLQENGRKKIELLFNILTYSVITRHIQEVSRDITAHSEACLTPVHSEPWYIQNPGIFRTLVYSEPWHILKLGIFRTVLCLYQVPWNIQNPSIFSTLLPSESWYIQNYRKFTTRAIFRTLVYSGSQAYWQPCQTYAIEAFIKIMQILFSTIF